ncbi:MAG: SDR family NAD(P)-dependent oxidoreductase [Gammaproteobacteria bacterium]
MPTYPWQRKYHWVEPAARRKEQKGHPLIGQAFHAAHSGDIIFQQQVSKESPAWLADHRVFQTMVMPGVAYLEMALAAGKQIFGTDTLTLSDFVMQQAMDWPDENQARTIQFVLQPEEANEYHFQIFSQATESPNTTVSSLWTRHATGQIRPATQDVTGTAALSLYALQAQFKHEISADLIYRGELEREIDLSANFWATERLWREETSCLSKISLPAALLREAGAYQMHPVLLEACFLALTVAYPEKYGRRTYVPFGVEHLHWNAYAGTEMWCHAELHPTVEDEPALLKADLRLFTPDGRLILVMAGVLVKIATRQAMLSARKAAWQHWLYQVSWQAQQSVAHTALTGHWLILADQLLGAKLGRLLASSGANFTLLFVGEQRTSIAPDSFSVNPADPDAFRIILSGLPALQGVINCWSLDNPQYLRDDTDLERILILHNTTILHLVQALTALPAPPRLWLVTQGAQAVDGSPVQDAVAASGWGSGKVIALEHLELKCTQIDLDPDVSADTQAEMLLSELRSEAAYPLEDQVAFRHQKRYVARLEQSSTQTGEIRFRNDSSYLLTGGLGGLGLKVARFMAEHGAGSLVLVGRNAAQPAVRTELAEIEAFGAHLRIVQADVSDKDQMAQVLGQISSEHPLRGILHLAGVLDDALLQHQNPERFAKVLAPKAMGAWHLHTLTLGHELDFFVLFSSVTALLGAAGQANYAAANAFLDGLAGYRRAQGLPALSINWASWTEVGMSARLGLDERLIQKGEGVIPPAQGLAALAHLISAQAETKVPIGVLPIAWPRFFSQHQEVPAFLTKLSPARGTNKPRISFREQLAATPSQEREAFLEKLVQEQVLKVLGLDPSVDLDPETGFFSLAMDSLNSIEIRNQLQTRLACTLPTTLLFDYPTPKALVAYLAQMLFATTEVPGQAANGIQHSTLAPLQPHGSRPPLFFVPGILGMVFDLAPLARQLGKEQPFYGLRSLGLDEDVTPYKQINQIAAHHIKALQAVQPQGPYFLGGHSFGGKVAFEMAQQLQEQGHEIALLAIVDSCVPVIGDEKEAAHWDEAKFIATLAAYYENIFGQKLALAESHSLSPDKQLDQLIDQLAKANPKLKQSRSEVRRILEVYKGNMLSYSEYIPKIFHPTQITLLRAASVGEFDFLPDEDFTLKDPFWGWTKVADNTRSIDLHLIPGNHFTMMNLPNVQVLAERLQTCLAQLYQ